MRKLFCLLSAVAALAGCATFGVNTAPPEPAVPEFMTYALPWGFFEPSPYSRIKVVETRLVCREYPAGPCEMKFDRQVGFGTAKVLYYPDWDAYVAVLAQPYYSVELTPGGIAAWFRAGMIDQGMLVPPVETDRNNVAATVSYTGMRNGKRVRGKMTAFYSPQPGIVGHSQLNVLYGEWPERSDPQMVAGFVRLAVALGFPESLD